MIIDTHCHLIPAINEERAARMAQYAIRAADIMGKAITPEAIVQKALETWADPTGERLITLMDDAGIDLTVICMVDDAGVPQLKSEMAQKANKIVGNIAGRYPDRVMALAGVDPRRPEAPDMLRQCFEEFGVKGLKYHPDYGYDPCGPESYRLLEVLAQYGGILLTHTGPLMPPARCKFADPRLLADLAVDQPVLPSVAHRLSGDVAQRPAHSE